MEEKIKLIITKLEDLKKKQEMDERDAQMEQDNNKENIQTLQSQNKRLASMRDVFETEEEEYKELNEEILGNEREIRKLESANGILETKKMEIRNNKTYGRELNEIDRLKEELGQELKEEQKFLIKNRNITEADIEERTAKINKEQNRLEADIEAIKRGIEKGFFLSDGPEVLKEQQNKLTELEAKYGENTVELRRLSEMKGLEEEEIYNKIDMITQKAEELERLTLENTKVNIELFEEPEENREEPISQEDMEMTKRKLAAGRVLENQYGILPGDMLYRYAMDALELNIEIGNFPEFAKRRLEELERLNVAGDEKGLFKEEIEKLKVEMEIAGIEENKIEASGLSQEEVDKIVNITKKEMEREARALEARKKLQEQKEKRKLAAGRVLEQYNIEKGDILYEKVMETIEANIPINNLKDFALQILENFENANKTDAMKGKLDEDIAKLKSEMDRSNISYKELEEATKKKEEEEARRKEEEEAAKKKEADERIAKKKAMEEARKQQQEEAKKKKIADEKAKINTEIEKFYNDNILSRGVKLAKVPRMQNSIKREMELGNKIENFEEYARQKLADIVRMNQRKDGRYQQIVKEFMKEMDLLGIQYDKVQMNKPAKKEEEKVNPQEKDSKQELILTKLKIGKTVEFVTKDKNTGEVSAVQNGFKSKTEADKNDIFDKEFMYQAILDTKMYEGLEISKGLKERLNPIVVKTLMRIDEEYATNGKYVKEYIKCMATRGKKSMSFDIEHDLKELNGGIIKQLLNKFKPNKDKVAKRKNEIIVETIQKYAMQAKYFGKNFSTNGKYDIFSKNKPKKQMEALPVIEEERKIDDFRKKLAVYGVSGKDIKEIKSPIMKEATFGKNKIEQEGADLKEEPDDDFEIFDID